MITCRPTTSPGLLAVITAGRVLSAMVLTLIFMACPASAAAPTTAAVGGAGGRLAASTVAGSAATPGNPGHASDSADVRVEGPTKSTLIPWSIKGPGSTSSIEPTATNLGWTRILWALGVVIALALLLSALGRKMLGLSGGGDASQYIRLLSHTPISRRQSVLLLQVGRRVLVVGDSNGQLSRLAEIDDPEEAASLVAGSSIESTSPQRSRFASMVRNAVRTAETPVARGGSAGLGPDAAPSELTESAGVSRQEVAGLLEKVRELSRMYTEKPR